MMDMDGQPNFSDDRVSDCQSFRSIPHPCGQPRKISIGILMDSFAMSGSKNVDVKESVVPTDENTTLSKANCDEDGKRLEGVVDIANKGKQTGVLEQKTSPWLSTRSIHQKLPISTQVHGTEPTKISLAAGTVTEIHNTIHVVKVPPYRKMFDGDTTAEGVEKPSFATTQKVVPEKEVVEDKATKEETKGSETLRMKLWEILGTISSPNEQKPNDEDLEMGAKDMKSFQHNDGDGNPVLKPGNNSDTIESDSECHDRPIRRPRTHSLTRKRASDKLKVTKVKNAQSTCYEKENQEKNTSSFREGFSARLHYAVSEGSLTFMRKKSEKWSPGIKTRTMCSLEQENPGQDQQVKDTDERKPSLEKSLSHGYGLGDNNEFCQRRKSGFIEPKSVAVEIDSHPVHLKKVSEHLRNVIDSPKLQKGVDWQDDVDHVFLKHRSEQNFDIPSPTFGGNTSNRRSTPSFPPSKIETHSAKSTPGYPLEANLWEADDESPAKMTSNTERIQSFKSFLASKLTCDKSDSQSSSSDDAGGLEGSHPMKPMPTVEEPGNRLFKLSSDDSESEILKEGSHVKGNEEKSNLHQHIELNQGDELASAVSLFALALERVKSKMKSVVRKRSAEILMSVAEGIHMQLQIAESEIQADIGKLTSLNKTKRKRLEMRIQELQGEFSIIHAKFKEEVHRYLQDCTNTVDDLDAHQMELRGTQEKQSASHRKLISQAEEAIETQLSDAVKRITEVHNLAREKMLQLKNVVADCFSEGNLS
ncbi:hypothetical protein ACH5RR_021599 [Cinchona calisaya]|uniref:Meiosis-specific protein ASY3-like coiled-coil domain-containing protein n=1 Tax=Cinchona calisaya TaxID=153742 RepID=A0ABD2ZL00_9GENT